MSFELRLRQGRVLSYDDPQVMAIINVTPDSFWSGSRNLQQSSLTENETTLRETVRRAVRDGATILDIGACSTRPGGAEVSEAEELRRLEWALPIVADMVRDNPLPVSVDTFRASVAEACITRWGADIINDVYGGDRDKQMFEVVNRLGAPYILTAPVADVVPYLDERLPKLSGAQVIIDPGFGFGKDVAQNYAVMRRLPELLAHYADHPVLVGISRKRMVWQLLESDPEHALNGTTVLNAFAAMQGAHILRVHDVRECVEAIRVAKALTRNF